ncbi:MAG: DUF2851 family protein [Chitinophagaceae bacterium]|nr:DUF2851 family protein [Chitinophagaceae bacterium]
MTEKLFQFIWQFQYFSKSGLTTTSGEPVHIIAQGLLNHNQGPDFLNAKIKIGKTTWVGNVELHIKASDWMKHRHQEDPNFTNVILHVVWEDDIKQTSNKKIPNIPLVVLKQKVSKILLSRYQSLLYSTSFIPCEKNIHTVNQLTWKSWKDRLLAERLARKSYGVEAYLEENKFHWEETFWWLLARNFGIKVNAESFEAIARTLPVNILAKHKSQIHQLEALLFGQAGLLASSFTEAYPKLLQKEYRFLQKKYGLAQINAPVFFLRMRPGNFPTIRLAQLAMLIHQSNHLFSKIKDTSSVKEVADSLSVTANDYWHEHYKFDEKSIFKYKKLGKATIENIIINTVCPIVFAYGQYHQEEKYKNKALRWLEELAPEKNNITRHFEQLGIANASAFDSQALIELKNEYCKVKRCLSCSIGNAILGK